MRWLIFLDTDHISGPARLALDFSVEARRLGHDIHMLGLVRGPMRPTAFTQAMEQAGIPTQLLRERFRFDPSVRRQFRSMLDTLKPDIYQSHGYKGSYLGRIARGRGIPWQAIFHGFTWENWRVRLYHALDVRWLRQADEVVAVSRDFENRLNRRGVPGARLRWVPNAISEAALKATGEGRALREKWFGPEHGDMVLAGVVGRFSPEKAPDLFLQALEQAARHNPALRGVLVGEGPTLDACRRMASERNLADRLAFPGFLSDVTSIYEALDLLVIPSRSEGMPTVLIEAMLMGVPVVSTRVGAVPDVVCDDRTALLTPIGDAEALAAAIGRLGGDRQLRDRLASAAGDLARQRLTVSERAQTLLDHARCLLEDRPLPAVQWEPLP